MDYRQAEEKAKNATFEEKSKMLRNGSEVEKIAVIPYFETNQLLASLQDASSAVRKSALVQICKRDDFYDLARGRREVATLAFDANPEVRQEVINIVNKYSGRFSLAKDNGSPACDAAYWEFVRTAEKLAVDPVPEIAASAEKALEAHYDRYPHTRPVEQEKTQRPQKDKGMDI